MFQALDSLVAALRLVVLTGVPGDSVRLPVQFQRPIRFAALLPHLRQHRQIMSQARQIFRLAVQGLSLIHI